MAQTRRPWMLPLVPLYAAGAALRWAVVEPKKLGWPVIGIGNLSTGGTGKTPFTIALARLLQDEGFHVDVLSRGYGRNTSAVEQVDPFGDAARFGDEPLLISRATGLPVFVGPSRFDAGKLAETVLVETPGIHLLDDGFQHRQLARQTDIVLINSEDLADHLLPAGNLRESHSALRRATVFAIPVGDRPAAEKLRALGLTQPIWYFNRRMEIPKIGGKVVAFCGIARPEQFFTGLEQSGLALAARHAFRDHQQLGAAELALLKSLIEKTGAATLITTTKDHVRLGAMASELDRIAPLHVADLRVELDEPASIAVWLRSRLQD